MAICKINHYCSDNAGLIITKFSEKNWNLYESRKAVEIGIKNVIRENLAATLKLDTPYVLLPYTKDPKDPDDVFATLEKVAVKLESRIPTIRIGGADYELTGITPREKVVKLHDPRGTHVTYDSFIDSIYSFVDARHL